MEAAMLRGPSRLRMPEYRGRNSWAPESARSERAGRFSGGRASLGSVGSLSSLLGPQDWPAAAIGGAPPGAPESAPSCDPTEGVADGDGTSAGALARGSHIRVAVRVRPLPPCEEGIIEVGGAGVINIRKDAATGGNEFLRSQQGRVEERTFDRVFGPDATQPEVFAWCCAPLVSEAVAKGRNATIFVYGATGAGKTYTMFGGNEPQHRGLIFRSITEVFRAIRLRDEGDGLEPKEASASLRVKVSFLEIYNEVVRDLLQEGGGGGQCRVLEDERRGVVKVANLLEVPVQGPEEALACLQSGMQVRTVEATAANSQSSRAHAVFTLTVEQVKGQFQSRGPFPRRGGEAPRLHARVSLIDLAGSERAALTQNSGSALKDGARINQSLLALANCIDALTARGGGLTTPRKKPPYRDSKLTLMLKGSLTGDGLVAMIANVHPGRLHFEDSNNTLEYARRASRVVAPLGRRLSRAFGFPAAAPTDDRQASTSLNGGTGAGEGLGDSPPVHSASRINGDGVDGLPEDGSSFVMGTSSSSSSSLPRPRAATQRRRRRHFAAEISAACGGAASEQPTTASSPEECPSELSLSWHPESAESPPQGVGGEVDSADSGQARAVQPEDDRQPSISSLDGEGEQEDRLALANALIARLRAEKLHLDGRLRAVVQERNALLRDRDALEEENDQLRAANLEKDEQLALLLAGCEHI